ncbi:hypothetical protein JYU34_018784, partial [Plutella xylostella]
KKSSILFCYRYQGDHLGCARGAWLARVELSRRSALSWPPPDISTCPNRTLGPFSHNATLKRRDCDATLGRIYLT